MKSARRVAVEALQRTEASGYANLVLDAALQKEGLTGRDRAFAARLFYGTLERSITLDYCLADFCPKGLQKLDAPLRAILRSGLYQAKYMDVPVSAAVNESVKLTKQMGKTSASGMVNAILRRAVARDLTDEKYPDETTKLSVEQSVSPAIAKLFLASYGTRAEAILAAFFAHGDTAIRVNPLRCTEDDLLKELEENGITAKPGFVPGSLRVAFPGSPAECKAFKQGRFHVQGLASQLAALSVQAEPGMKVVDLCAAPGGKSITMAECMQNKGSLLAGELAESRVPLLKKAFARMGIACATAKQWDATAFDASLQEADRVLCDVPCSGLGTLGKKPDIRQKDLSELNSLYTVQASILENASRYLKPNGRLVYSTCTLNPAENEEQIGRFLANHKNWHLADVPLAPPGAVCTPLGMTLLPDTCDTDGFFIAILEHN